MRAGPRQCLPSPRWCCTLQGTIFLDRDGKHFRHILNWLRDASIPYPNNALYHELLQEADYFQLRVSEILQAADCFLSRVRRFCSSRTSDASSSHQGNAGGEGRRRRVPAPRAAFLSD